MPLKSYFERGDARWWGDGALSDPVRGFARAPNQVLSLNTELELLMRTSKTSEACSQEREDIKSPNGMWYMIIIKASSYIRT